jgi:hypothetical protein
MKVDRSKPDLAQRLSNRLKPCGCVNAAGMDDDKAELMLLSAKSARLHCGVMLLPNLSQTVLV